MESLRFGVEAARTRVVVDSDKPLDYFVFTLAQQGSRVVIDLSHVDFALAGRDIGSGQRASEGDGLVAAYRYADNSPTRSRIVLDLEAPAKVVDQFQLPPGGGSDTYRLVLDLAPVSAEEFRADAGYPVDRVRNGASNGERARAASAPAERRVVVLDPGHGGDDSGAPGANGVREADVNLALARSLRDALEATGRYDVVMTRDDDSFISLNERVRIARTEGADLFLSLHADSAASGSSVKGASVYTLSDSAEQRTRTEILQEEPWILNVDLRSRQADVGDILVDLVHRDTRNQSSAFAETLIDHLRDTTPLLRNSHRSRGFYVLLAPDVPAVLLEAGFVTNPEDEARLTSPAKRAELAASISGAIDSYFDQRERLYAAR